MPIKLRCYCGYVLTLRSALAGKKIRCTECDEVLTVPVPGQKKAQKKRRPPRRDPWDEGFAPQPSYEQPSYEQPEYFLPGSVGSPSTPHRRRKRSRQSSEQITKYVGIVFVVVFFGCAGILGMFAFKNRIKLDTPANERARVVREVGRGKFTDQTYTNDYFKLKITIPPDWKYIDSEIIEKLKENSKNNLGIQKGSKEDANADLQQVLIMAEKSFKDPLKSHQPNLGILAVRIDSYPEDDTPHKYLQSQNEVSTQVYGTNHQSGEIRDNINLGSLSASSLRSSISINGGVVRILKIAARVDDYMLIVSGTYTTEDERRELERIVHSIQASE